MQSATSSVLPAHQRCPFCTDSEANVTDITRQRRQQAVSCQLINDALFADTLTRTSQISPETGGNKRNACVQDKQPGPDPPIFAHCTHQHWSRQRLQWAKQQVDKAPRREERNACNATSARNRSSALRVHMGTDPDVSTLQLCLVARIPADRNSAQSADHKCTKSGPRWCRVGSAGIGCQGGSRESDCAQQSTWFRNGCLQF
eukprot:1141305-Pelagomonas_calceolata.AAC.5